LNAIGNGWEMFLSFVLFLAHLWTFLLVAGIAWITYRYFQQSRKIAFSNAPLK
jgi:hypothetical protein